uniref:Uncharacterized protein n=1 Tax=Anopheles maculatus TaxID=74869 RepID=A0A182SEU0_9DIPT
MAPNATVEATGVLNELDAETIDGGLAKDVAPLKRAEKRKIKLVWRNVIAFGYLHLAAVYGAFLMLTSARLYTIAFGKLCPCPSRSLLSDEQLNNSRGMACMTYYQ